MAANKQQYFISYFRHVNNGQGGIPKMASRVELRFKVHYLYSSDASQKLLCH